MVIKFVIIKQRIFKVHLQSFINQLTVATGHILNVWGSLELNYHAKCSGELSKIINAAIFSREHNSGKKKVWIISTILIDKKSTGEADRRK